MKLKRQNKNFPAAAARLGDLVRFRFSAHQSGCFYDAVVFKLIPGYLQKGNVYPPQIFIKTEKLVPSVVLIKVGDDSNLRGDRVVIIPPVAELRRTDPRNRLRSYVKACGLVIARASTAGDEPQYRILDPLRAYGEIVLQQTNTEWTEIRFADGKFYNRDWSQVEGSMKLLRPVEIGGNMQDDELAMPSGFEPVS